MTRFKTARQRGDERHQAPPPPRFSSQQLTTIAIVVVGLFVIFAAVADKLGPRELTPDHAFVLPAGWVAGMPVPPVGSREIASQDFIAMAPAQGGKRFELTEENVNKMGVSFEHDAGAEEMQAYVERMLPLPLDFELSDTPLRGIDNSQVLAVWNGDQGFLTVILLHYDERYELRIHQKR